MKVFQRLFLIAYVAMALHGLAPRALAGAGLSFAYACRAIPVASEISLSGDKHEFGLSRKYYTVQSFQENTWKVVVLDGGTVATPNNEAAIVWVQDSASKVTAYTVFKGGQVIMSDDFIVLRKKANPTPFAMGEVGLDFGLVQGQQVLHCRTKASIRGWSLSGDCWGTPAINSATGCQETACEAGNGHCFLQVYNTDGSGGSTSADCGTAGAKFIECANNICWTFGNYIP